MEFYLRHLIEQPMALTSATATGLPARIASTAFHDVPLLHLVRVVRVDGAYVRHHKALRGVFQEKHMRSLLRAISPGHLLRLVEKVTKGYFFSRARFCMFS